MTGGQRFGAHAAARAFETGRVGACANRGWREGPVTNQPTSRPAGSSDGPVALGLPVGRAPLRTRLGLERGDRGLERGEEVGRVDRPGQLVAVDLASHRVLHLGEDEVDTVRR